MKAILIILGIICIVIGAVYLLQPANALPSFFPGYDPGLTSIHLKHGLAAGALGIVLILIGWFMGRR